MKTKSILMSSFGALLIFIAVNENAVKNIDVVSKPNQIETPAEPMPVVIEAISAIPATPVSVNATDFSYLQFNVSNFETADASIDEMPEEADYAFLKFNVSDYIGSEPVVLPEDSDFDYLKFDVTNYTSSPYYEELPITDLSYLKFDVKKFMQNDPVIEINEFSE